MKRTLPGVIAALFLAVIASLPVVADDFIVYLDTDRSSATGCDVPGTGQSPAGIEVRVRATVERPPAVSQAAVTSVESASCDAASGTFGAPTVTAINVPVGSDLGVDASDVVEYDLPTAGLGLAPGTTIDLYKAASDGTTVFQQATAQAFSIPSVALPPGSPGAPQAIPALSTAGILLLALAIAVLALRRRNVGPWVAGAMLVLAPALAWLAVKHVSDGRVDEWVGVSPVASSPAGTGPTPDTDIRQLFIAEQSGSLFLRVDVTELDVVTPPMAKVFVDNPNPKVGARVVLHGAPSDPVLGPSVAFNWTLDQVPAGSAVVIADAAAADQSFTPDVAGDYSFTLVVTSPRGISSVPASVTVAATAVSTNAAPHALVTAPMMARVGDALALSGAGSTDADGDTLTYTWSVATRPAGSSATLSSTTVVGPSFTPDVAGDYRLQLVVSDGTVDSAPAEVTFSVVAVTPTVNLPPVISAGPDQHVTTGQEVELRSTISDPEGDSSTVTWNVLSAPTGSSAQVRREPRGLKAELHDVFTPDVAGSYSLELRVQDAAGNLTKDTARVLADPPAATPHPVADAGSDQVVKVGDTVTLDGRNSYDADGPATLTYQWSFSSLPAGSMAMLSDPSSATPTFVADEQGDYVVQLVAVEGGVNSAPIAVTITANPAMTSLYQQLLDLGLDATDAHFIENNHAAEAQSVVAKTDRIWQGFALTDAMFRGNTAPGAPSFQGVCPAPNFVDWTDASKTRFRKIFGRLNFVINTDRFQQVFDAQASLLDPAYEGNAPFIPFPADYAAFKAAINQALTAGGNELTLFLCETATGTAYGVPPLRLMVEKVMMGESVVSASQAKSGWTVNGAAPLVFHELTHSFGYAHDAGTQTDLINGKPNNIPYFVQIILGYQGDDIVNAYCGGSVASCKRFYKQGSPNSLLTEFFGQAP